MTTDRSNRTYRRSIALRTAGALLFTALVYVDFWDGSLPTLPAPGPLAVAVGAGALLGGGSAYLRDRSDVGILTWFGLLIFVTALGLGLLMFPDGLPVAAEFVFIAFVWASAITSALTTASDRRSSHSSA